jgi:hypothetical protein
MRRLPRAEQSIPIQGSAYLTACWWLPWSDLGLEEAKAETVQVLSLQPSFSAGGFCAGLGLPAVLAEPLAKAWREAGLPP